MQGPDTTTLTADHVHTAINYLHHDPPSPPSPTMTMVMGVDHLDPTYIHPHDDEKDDNHKSNSNSSTTSTTTTTTITARLDVLKSLELLSALTYFPPFSQLAEWQYDLNLRRAGALGVDRLYRHAGRVAPCRRGDRNELCIRWERLDNATLWHRAMMMSAYRTRTPTSPRPTPTSTGPTPSTPTTIALSLQMTSMHWQVQP